jgi:hypothetical protein
MAKSKRPLKCRKCGLPIAFKKLSSGKYCPTNPDGSDHFDLCRETIRGGRPFDPARDMRSSGWITGEHYKPDSNPDEIPWD